MSFNIIASLNEHVVYCAGSFTKFLTTYVTLTLLSKQFVLDDILDDDNFLDGLCQNRQSREFLLLFQNIIKNKFTVRDLCSHYSGLPYTFDLSTEELVKVELGNPFKHHAVPFEAEFLARCHNNITPVYTNRCKFHYSEIGIMFLGYLMEKIYKIDIANLYHQHIIEKYLLKSSFFSRTRPANVYCQDLSSEYDYPSIAVLDHGYFSYSNGYYTTLHDMKVLLENLVNCPIFKVMTDIKHARAASNRLLNGLSVEIRLIEDDIVYGYEGLSFSGCNIWAYSTKHQQGHVTFSNNEETIYDTIYNQWDYHQFDKVPDYAQQLYWDYLKKYNLDGGNKDIPSEYQGNYHRVNINQKSLEMTFVVGRDFIIVRNPKMIKYDIVYNNGNYCIKGKDGVHGAKVGFYEAKSGNKYMHHDGTLYKKVSQP